MPPGRSYERPVEVARSNAGYVRVRVDGQTYSSRRAVPTVDRRRKHTVEVIVDRVVVTQESRAPGIGRQHRNTPGPGPRRAAHRLVPDEEVPEPSAGVTKIHSQHLVCTACNRSFEPLSPHHFSFNSSLGWCEACEGLGVEIGRRSGGASARARNSLWPKGAILAWPSVNQPLFGAMLAALSKHTGLPTDVPFDRLSPRQRRVRSTLRHRRRMDRSERRDCFTGRLPVTLPIQGPLSRAGRSLANLSPVCAHDSKSSWARSNAASAAAAGCATTPRRCGSSRIDRSTSTAVHRWANCSLRLRSGSFRPRDKKVAGELVREITNRLTFLVEVGLEYLTIGRSAPTLSGGESQRIRLASARLAADCAACCTC